MYILAIDTSCDDTSVAVAQNTVVLSNIVSSQDEIHGQWGGVVPSLAKRAHKERIDTVVRLACKRARIGLEDIDVFAVTYGPGLAVSLEVGVEKAKELSKIYKKPLVAVNHMMGHMCSNFESFGEKEIQLPTLSLLVSGGHTELVVMKDKNSFSILGQTLDDAAGEAFDKVARMLGLGYPGGSLLSTMAKDGDDCAYALPIPLVGQKRIAFSFSGIKTAVMRLIKEITLYGQHALTKKQIQDVAATFQRVAIAHLVKKSKRAVEESNPKVFLLGGGVAANTLLRKELRKMLKPFGIPLLYPKKKKLCADNAGMIAIAAYYLAKEKKYVSDIDALERNPIASIEEISP